MFGVFSTSSLPMQLISHPNYPDIQLVSYPNGALVPLEPWRMAGAQVFEAGKEPWRTRDGELIQVNKQTNKQTHTHKETNELTDKLIKKQINKNTNKLVTWKLYTGKR